MKSGNFNFLEPSGPLQACNGTALSLPCSIKVRDNSRKSYKKCNSLPRVGCQYFEHLFTKGIGNVMCVSIKKMLIISQNCFGALCWFNRDRVKNFFVLIVSNVPSQMSWKPRVLKSYTYVWTEWGTLHGCKRTICYGFYSHKPPSWFFVYLFPCSGINLSAGIMWN